MKCQTIAILLFTVAAQMPMARAEFKLARLEKAAERDTLKADKHNQKAELDVAANKPRQAEREARKAALDEIKSDKEIQRLQVDKAAVQ